MSTVILDIKNLSTITHNGKKVIENISFSINSGECVCLMGKSGCGKTTTLLSILSLFDGKSCGMVMFKGKNILNLSDRELTKVRGCGISMIFQNPRFALNPVKKIGRQIEEAILCHQKLSKNELRTKCFSLLEKVHLPPTMELYNSYPHQLSGGMGQRVVIAIALSCSPSLILADEPTSSLDYELEGEIISLLKSIKGESALLISTHSPRFANELGDRVVTIKNGEVENIYSPNK